MTNQKYERQLACVSLHFTWRLIINFVHKNPCLLKRMFTFCDKSEVWEGASLCIISISADNQCPTLFLMLLSLWTSKIIDYRRKEFYAKPIFRNNICFDNICGHCVLLAYLLQPIINAKPSLSFSSFFISLKIWTFKIKHYKR